MWDNGIPDDPSTIDINEHQVLIAVGDTFSGPNSAGWRPNTIFRSSDTDLTDGMTIADGQWFNGNMVRRSTVGPEFDHRETDHLQGKAAGRSGQRRDADPDGRHFPSHSRHRVRGDPVPQLHVGEPVGLARPVDDELLRDRILDGQRRELDRRSSKRPTTTSRGAATRTSSSRRSSGPATDTSTRTAPRMDAKAPRTCRASAEKDILDLSKYEYYSAGSPGGGSIGSDARRVVQERSRQGHPGLRAGHRRLRRRQPRQHRSARCRCSTTSR